MRRGAFPGIGGILILWGLVGCEGGAVAWMRGAYRAPRAWTLYDEGGRAVSVRLEPLPEGVRFQAGPVEILWQEGGSGYVEQDTVELIDGGQIRLWVFPSFLVYPLPPLPGLAYREVTEDRAMWGERRVTLRAVQEIRVDDGPTVHLSRTLRVDDVVMVEETRVLHFRGETLRRLDLIRRIQEDTLRLVFTDTPPSGMGTGMGLQEAGKP